MAWSLLSALFYFLKLFVGQLRHCTELFHQIMNFKAVVEIWRFWRIIHDGFCQMKPTKHNFRQSMNKIIFVNLKFIRQGSCFKHFPCCLWKSINLSCKRNSRIILSSRMHWIHLSYFADSFVIIDSTNISTLVIKNMVNATVKQKRSIVRI